MSIRDHHPPHLWYESRYLYPPPPATYHLFSEDLKVTGCALGFRERMKKVISPVQRGYQRLNRPSAAPFQLGCRWPWLGPLPPPWCSCWVSLRLREACKTQDRVATVREGWKRLQTPCAARMRRKSGYKGQMPVQRIFMWRDKEIQKWGLEQQDKIRVNGEENGKADLAWLHHTGLTCVTY